MRDADTPAFDPVPWLTAWLDSSEDYGVVLMTLEARVVYANPAIERVLGYRPEELVGDTLRRIFTEADIERGLDVHEIKVAKRVGRSEDDRWHVGKGGRRIWANGVLSLLRNSDTGTPFGLAKVFRDRTDQRTEVESMKNGLRGASASLEHKADVLATVGHELRNPVAVIGQAASVIRSLNGDTLLPNAERALGLVERQTSVLHRLLEDLRDATRSSQAPPRLAFAPVVINDAIASALQLHEVEARRRDQHIEVVLPDPPIVLEADPIRLEQILGNVIGNATKYTPARGRIAITATVEGENILIRVDDNGMGIDAATMPAIFDLFAREARAVDMTEDGLGVGLALVRQLVSLHHGRVEAQSAGPGMGSRFTISLPRVQPAQAQTRGPQREP